MRLLRLELRHHLGARSSLQRHGGSTQCARGTAMRDGGSGDPHRAQRQERIGLLCAAYCALNGAFVPAFAKLTTNAAAPLSVAAITTLCAGLSAAVVLWMRAELRLLTRGPAAGWLLAVGSLGTAIAFLLFFWGARQASAIDTVLCLQSEPAYSLLLTWLVLGHRPTRRRLGAITFLLSGIALAVGAHGFDVSIGIWLLLATPLCWQLSHLIVLRRLVGLPPSVLTGARYIDGGVILSFLWLTSGGMTALPPPAAFLRVLPLLVFQGVVLSYLGTLVWYQAITRLDLARTTAIVVPSIPLLSLAASFLLLGEVPSPTQCIGLVLTATGVFAFVTAPHVGTGFQTVASPASAVLEATASAADSLRPAQ